jgi:hypothetical protein
MNKRESCFFLFFGGFGFQVILLYCIIRWDVIRKSCPVINLDLVCNTSNSCAGTPFSLVLDSTGPFFPISYQNLLLFFLYYTWGLSWCPFSVVVDAIQFPCGIYCYYVHRRSLLTSSKLKQKTRYCIIRTAR